jgi:hypothetical protein
VDEKLPSRADHRAVRGAAQRDERAIERVAAAELAELEVQAVREGDGVPRGIDGDTAKIPAGRIERPAGRTRQLERALHESREPGRDAASPRSIAEVGEHRRDAHGGVEGAP